MHLLAKEFQHSFEQAFASVQLDWDRNKEQYLSEASPSKRNRKAKQQSSTIATSTPTAPEAQQPALDEQEDREEENKKKREDLDVETEDEEDEKDEDEKDEKGPEKQMSEIAGSDDIQGDSDKPESTSMEGSST